MILFLDVDGVLHPDPAPTRHYFCRLPLLEEILMDFSKVQIVISSVWRLDWAAESDQIEGMKEHFSLALKNRIVGVTPDHRQTSTSRAPEGLADYLREWECMDWLRTHRLPGTLFLILDDRPWLFRPNNPHLMVVDCDDGLLPDNEAELRSRLARMGEQANDASGEPS
ncbi:MAG: HAD domain-containing protein [Polaromonas sp.]|nr:HAD domain-containing protein [Polaromonas sp.]